MKRVIGSLSLMLILFTACQSGLSDKDKETYTAKGKEIAQATFKNLSGELVSKMKEGGVSKAVPFCNANAANLSNEMADKFNVSIKRTSYKVRNEKNLPTSEEQVILDRFKTSIAEAKELKPIVEIDNAGNPHFYAPIKTKKKCLACHGVVGESMKHEADSIIKVLYPNDKAIGFKEGDLRGIWSITFNEK